MAKAAANAESLLLPLLAQAAQAAIQSSEAVEAGLNGVCFIYGNSLDCPFR